MLRPSACYHISNHRENLARFCAQIIGSFSAGILEYVQENKCFSIAPSHQSDEVDILC